MAQCIPCIRSNRVEDGSPAIASTNARSRTSTSYQRQRITKMKMPVTAKELIELALGKEFDEIIAHFQDSEQQRDLAGVCQSSKKKQDKIYVTIDEAAAVLRYCARSSTYKASTALELIIEKFGDECLQIPDLEGVTALHLVMQFQKLETWKKYLNRDWTEDSTKNCWFHYAAKNATLPGFWEIITKEMDIHELMLQENAQKQIPLHFVAQYQSKELVYKAFCLVIGEKKPTEFKDAMENNLLHYAGSGKSETLQHLLTFDPALFQVILTRNSQGQTPLHFAAQSKSLTPDLFNKVVEDQKMSALDVMNKVDNEGRSITFYACMGNNFDLLRNCNVELQLLLKADNDDNTLLHALFKYYSYKNDFDKDDWTQMFLDLVDAGCDPKAENSRHHNCLLASEMHHEDLRDIMSSMDSDLTDKLQELVTNSNGEHAVHIFSGRYAVQHIIEDLSTLCDKSEEDLLQLKAEKGRLKGGTCLHFACELGQLDSVTWLMSKGLKLSDRTSSGESCIDVAYKRGKHIQILDNLMEREKYDELISALQLIDFVQTSLPAPRKSSAKKNLDTFTDHQVQSVRNQATATADMHDEPQLKILLRAIQIDSCDLLRSMLSFHASNFSDSILKKFPGFCLAAAARDPSSFQLNFLSDCGDIDLSELRAAEVAVLFGAFDVAVDLLQLSQFDLIPNCLRLLILLKKIKTNKRMRGCLKQRTDLKNTVTNMVVNALDSLYENADDETKELVFMYLRGDFRADGEEEQQTADDRPSEWREADGSTGCGPRFSLLSQNPKDNYESAHDVIPMASDDSNEYSVIELIEKLSCKHIFASNCITSFSNREWETRRNSRFSATDKLWIHSVSMLVFMVFLSWLFTDFIRSISYSISWILLLLYSLSLTVLEFNDIYYLKKKYFTEWRNIIDLLALIFLWLGSFIYTLICTVFPVSLSLQHFCQIALGISFLWWGFRFISLSSCFKKSGIIIAMLRKMLLHDLMPFLVILLVVVISFGVMQFSLLFPTVYAPTSQTATSNYTSSVFMQIWCLPMRLMFGLLEFEDLQSASDELEQSPGSVAHPGGKTAFQIFFMFAFLIIVNIVMVNVLIALFSLRVSKMEAEAQAIWSRRYLILLREYQRSSWVPHPFLFFWWVIQKLQASAQKAKRLQVRQERMHENDQEPLLVRDLSQLDFDVGCGWWNSEKQKYPKDYCKFLKQQSIVLRKIRSHIGRQIVQHKTESHGLKSEMHNAIDDCQHQIIQSTESGFIDIKQRMRKLQSDRLAPSVSIHD